jgi:hypothetical protein
MTCSRREIERLEHLFTQNRLSRRQFVAGLTALGVSASGIDMLVGTLPERAVAQQAMARYLVILVMDAFRADYMDLAPMPNLAALAKEGTSFGNAWVGQIESETPTGHATIGTGSTPRHDGIIGFEWRYAGTNREALDGWPPGVVSGAMERDMREAGVPSISLAVKGANPHAKVVAISSEKVYAADALGGWAADYILYHERQGTTGPIVPAALSDHLPPPDFFSHSNLKTQFPLKHFTDWDYLSTVLAVTAIEQFLPQVLMVNLPGADVYGHPYGGPATPSVMAQVVAGVDHDIGRIVQAYKNAHIFDQTLFVVTADHGMVPNDRAVDAVTTKALVKEAGGQYFFHTGGTAAYTYLQNPPTAPAAAAKFASTSGVEGAYFRSLSTGVYETASGPSIDPALEAAHRYLLDTFVGSTAPDVVAAFRENTIGNKLSFAYGNHGGLNWGAQRIPLVMRGPGVPAGVSSVFPARLMDIAPTVLRLLGIAAPDMDGIVLADAVSDPSADEVSTQASVQNDLFSHVTALQAQSVRNIAEDRKARLAPPPSRPLQP